MKNTNNNGQSSEPSRGEKALDTKADFSNALENNIEISTTENAPEYTYSAENSEFNNFINTASTTKAELASQEKKQASESESKYMSAEQAMDIALTGLAEISEMAQEHTGKKIVFGEKVTMLFAAMTAPVIRKYGAKINIDPENVDLDSWMPEIMALGGVALAGFPMYKQITDPENVLVIEDKTHGDKS